MAKQNGRSQDVTRPVAVPAPKASIAPNPVPQGIPAPACRCGAVLSRGTMPDGSPAWARIHLVPEGFDAALLALNAPQLDAAILICVSCKRIEFVWTGR